MEGSFIFLFVVDNLVSFCCVAVQQAGMLV